MIIWDDLKWVKEYYLDINDFYKSSVLNRFPNLIKSRVCKYCIVNGYDYKYAKKLIEDANKYELESLKESLNYVLEKKTQHEFADFYVDDGYNNYSFDDYDSLTNRIDRLQLSMGEFSKAKRSKIIEYHKVAFTKSEIDWCINSVQSNIQRKILIAYLYVSKYFNVKWVRKLSLADITELTGIRPSGSTYKAELKKIMSVNNNKSLYRNKDENCILYNYDEYERYLKTVNKVCINIPQIDDDNILFECYPHQLASFINEYTPSIKCAICGCEYIPTNNRQRYCSECKTKNDNEKVKERMRRYRSKKS